MKYLFDIHHGIGDVIQLEPAIRAIKENDCFAEIGLIVQSEKHATLINGDGMIDELYALPKHKDIVSWVRMIKRARKKGYQIGFVAPCITNINASKFLLQILGCKRIEMGIKDGLQLDKDTLNERTMLVKLDFVYALPDTHRVARNLSMVKKLIGVPDRSSPRLHFAVPMEFQHPQKGMTGTPRIGICLGGNQAFYKGELVDFKRWPVEKFVCLAERLSSGAAVYLIGGTSEQENYHDELTKLSIDKNPYNLVGALSLEESAAVIGKCDLVVGNENGMMHVAAALSTPSITLFGPTHPLNTGAVSQNAYFFLPRSKCRFCYVTEPEKALSCQSRECINSISVDAVYAAVLDVLKNISDD